MEQPSPAAPQRWALLSQTVLLAHAAGAIAWWWLMPGGFPTSNAHFWANQAIPAAVLCIASSGLYGHFMKKAKLFETALLFLPVLWTAIALAAVIIFPISAAGFLSRALTIIAIVSGTAFLARPARWSLARRESFAIVACGTLLGIAIPAVQRAPDPDTSPINEPAPQFSAKDHDFRTSMSFELPNGTTLLASDGSTQVRCGNLKLDLQPLLTFESRSPDRCWTVFAPRNLTKPPPRKLTDWFGDKDKVVLCYEDIAAHALRISGENQDHGTSMEVFATFTEPVYSHLNSFCSVVVSGHHKLSISFSPCNDVRIDFQPADYPTGRPMRSAYIDANRVFHVVEAESGEKGPFRELARGPLGRGQPLLITLYDNGHAACVITFDDWADQAGTALSPTAGWGLPVNAIEFSLLGDPPESSAAIWLTLAATSIGRGWDSVGHNAGTYRNRMRLAPAK